MKKLTTEVTMREFRAAPAKILRRAARTKKRLRVGEFVLTVEEAKVPEGESFHGCMREYGKILCDPSELLSANDHDSTDD